MERRKWNSTCHWTKQENIMKCNARWGYRQLCRWRTRKIQESITQEWKPHNVPIGVRTADTMYTSFSVIFQAKSCKTCRRMCRLQQLRLSCCWWRRRVGSRSDAQLFNFFSLLFFTQSPQWLVLRWPTRGTPSLRHRKIQVKVTSFP